MNDQEMDSESRSIGGRRMALQRFLLAMRRRPWIWPAAAGAFIHLATAMLRLNSFFPQLRLLDFASYYAAAWSLRLGRASYQLQPDFIGWLSGAQDVNTGVPPLNSPPLWAWLMRPLTLLPFPQASLVWLLLLLLLALGCARWLGRSAGLEEIRWPGRLLLVLLVISFGPTFLNLTLGQNGMFLLAAALWSGIAIEARDSRSAQLAAAIGGALAIAAKLFPLLWLGGLLLLERWRLALAILILAPAGMGIVALAHPEVNQEYWATLLPARNQAFSEAADLDDQSLLAWLQRLGRTNQYQVPGLSLLARRTVTWQWPWSIPRAALAYVAYGLLAAAGLGLLWLRRGLRPADAVGYFYLWVLFSLLLVPHMARYNHVLLLPALAWLWRRQRPGIVALVYLLAALSRLNHLWALLLPVPWGPLASGFGVTAVLAAAVSMVRLMGEDGHLRLSTD